MHVIYKLILFLGVYIPACDSEGYYEHTQCHSSVGMCWCVDKHGVEVPNSRVRGKPNCCMCFCQLLHIKYVNIKFKMNNLLYSSLMVRKRR